MAFFDSKIRKLTKSKSRDFSKGVRSMVFDKNLKFLHLFIFGKIRKENEFDNILERKKKMFYTIKKQKVKKVQKLAFFQKG